MSKQRKWLLIRNGKEIVEEHKLFLFDKSNPPFSHFKKIPTKLVYPDWEAEEYFLDEEKKYFGLWNQDMQKNVLELRVRIQAEPSDINEQDQEGKEDVKSA
jgi:hypothetical protein